MKIRLMINKRFCVVVWVYVCILHARCIHAQTDTSLQKSVTQVKGIYDAQKQTYFGQFVDPINLKIIHQYKVEKYVESYGIAEYYTLNTENHFKSNKLYGLMDTSGNVLIPCIYKALGITGNKLCYHFESDTKRGLIKLNKGTIFEFPKLNESIKTEDFKAKHNSFVSFDKNGNYALVRLRNLQGVFSFHKEKLIVPNNYHKITLQGHIAVCQIMDKYIVYNCERELKSDILKEFHVLNGGKYYFMRFLNSDAIICTDPISPQSTIAVEMNKDSVLEFHNHHIIAKKKDKIGLIDEFGVEKVPFVYENVYFLDKELLLVKKDDLWAISDYQNNLLTKFQFVNVEQQNHVNLKNFIQFSGIDTSDAIINKYFDYERGYGKYEGYLLREIQKELIRLKKELNSHKISVYDRETYGRYVLQSKNGFQIVTAISKEEVKIDTLCWDNVFMIPYIYDYPFEIGVQKGNKFGYYNDEVKPKKYLKYDGIYFYHKLFDYSGIYFSGTHEEKSPFAILKKGYVYYKASYPRTNWIEKLTSPPNYPCTYQGKAKWYKYMKETTFLEKRKKNDVVFN